jgi:hypothetical protein
MIHCNQPAGARRLNLQWESMTPRGRAVLSGLAVALLFALPLLPEILGTRRLIFRDAEVTHWPWRRVAAAALAAGEVPFVNEHASGGQPLLANPNAVLLYPTFLLETLLPPVPAFNLHYLLHVLWAFLGARLLARKMGLAEGAALLSGAAFAFSGMVLSYTSAFMNSGAAASWLPWCAAGALDLARARDRRGTVRAAVATGLALGLQLLAGEPAISALTAVFAGALSLAEALAIPAGGRLPRLGWLLAGGTGAALLALGLAAPLLLPLRQVFPLTFRGQHLYSRDAFGAAPFEAWRFAEWLLPRLRGDPGVVGAETSWLDSGGNGTFVYIWCVTFGLVPFLLLLCAGLRRDFWDRRSVALAAAAGVTLALSFGFSLPLYRLLYGLEALRRLRYPIKFYLLTTVCVSILAGIASASLGRRRPGGRERLALAGMLVLFGAVWAASARGGAVERFARTAGLSLAEDAPRIDAFRSLVRGDALVGALAVLLVGGLLLWRPGRSERGYALGFLTVLLALPWGLPLFVSGNASELDRHPALLNRMRGPGRLFVESSPPVDLEALDPSYPRSLPRLSALARVRVERLFPETGAVFGVRYLFDTDPDGSYGYYNRVASEAAAASSPIERDRLLRAYGARWVLADEGKAHPLFHAVTGLSVARERLVLFEDPDPVAELRWAGRVFRRRALSGTLELVRSPFFDPRTDVALPGRDDVEPSAPATRARIRDARVRADRAQAEVEAEGAGFLLFSRTFFPSWKARVDGRAAPVLVANARDLAVAVPAGRHSVEIEFDRFPFRAGVVLQVIALLVAAVAGVGSR